LWVAVKICLTLLVHLVRLAASRTFWMAGSSSPIRMAMMAITTSNSISVKPCRERAINTPLIGEEPRQKGEQPQPIKW
jgi:hypothetical protein